MGRGHGTQLQLPLWLTYRQATELGGQVRKGQKGSLVVYANEIVRTDTDDSGADVEVKIPFMKGYPVFNGEQIDGLPGHFYATQPPLKNQIERLEFAERFFSSSKITVQHGGNRAFYSVDRDVVQMPEFQTFRDGDSYYATLAHECCHATRHPARLNRDPGRKKCRRRVCHGRARGQIGSASYAATSALLRKAAKITPLTFKAG